MSAILPFLRDRSELSLQSMRYFHLQLGIEEGRYQISQQEHWARVFTETPKFGSLNLQKLTMRIFGPYCRYARKLRLGTKMQHWVHEMVKNITSLDMLSVTLDYGVRGGRCSNEVKWKHSPTEELLWDF